LKIRERNLIEKFKNPTSPPPNDHNLKMGFPNLKKNLIYRTETEAVKKIKKHCPKING